MTEPKADEVADLSRICGTAVTIDLIENVVKGKISTKSKIVKFDAEDFGTGKGFLSVMAKVKLTWEPADENLPKCVIAKIPTASKLPALFGKMEGGQKMIDHLTNKLHRIHNCEVSVYELFSRFENTDTPCPVPLPYVYGVKKMIDGGEHTHPAYIIMEDLCVKNSLLNFLQMELISEQQLKEVICALGKLHAWSLNHMSVAKEVLEPIDLKQLLEEMMAGFDQQWDENLASLNTPEYIELLGQHVVDQIPSFKLSKERIMGLQHLHERHNIPSVLCHGDMHSNNVMFAKDANGKAVGKLAAIYDWQISHFGGPAGDLVKILQIAGDVQKYTKLEYRQQIVKMYYDNFESTHKGTMPFSLDVFRAYFEELYLTNMRLSTPYLPQMLRVFAGPNESLGISEGTAKKMSAKMKEDGKVQMMNVIELLTEEKQKLEKGVSDIKI